MAANDSTTHCILPARETRAELTVINSRFITTISPALDVEQARQFIKRIKAEFPDATHHVPAFIIGHGNSTIEHCHDDGEPAGTAGRPALAVLKGSGMGDAVLVVTRYFGGTKLGKGGLVRAYSDAVKEVLKNLELAEKIPTHKVTITIPYSLFQRTRQLSIDHAGKVLDTVFAGEVTMTLQLPVDSFPAFTQAVSRLSHGKVQAAIVETNPATLLPYRKKQPVNH